jgi:hypothetical protein
LFRVLSAKAKFNSCEVFEEKEVLKNLRITNHNFYWYLGFKSGICQKQPNE